MCNGDIQWGSDTVCVNKNAKYSCEGKDFVAIFK